MSELHELIFPPFRLDVMHGRLCRDAECVPIRLKTLAVLRYLIEYRERVVSRDELSQAIWPGRFGADAAPKQCILELRKLLGDSACHPRFIETIGRYGYRFIGLLEAESDSLAAPGSADAGCPDATRQDCCVGRDVALARLQTAWEQAQAGRPQCVLLLGPAGIGKSTVAKTFIQRVDVGHGWVARGQCVEQCGKGEAYLSLLDALGSLARGRWQTRLVHTLDRHAPLWLLQSPALIPPGGEAALRQRVQGADNARMLRELIAALEALTCNEPGLLLLEDLHWASPSTLEWLNAWTLRYSSARLLLMATWRTGDDEVNGVGDHPTPSLLNEWRRRPGVTMLPLAELDRAAVETYLNARFADKGLASHLAPVLHHRSGGQPFLMQALVKQWLARHLLAPVEDGWRLTVDLDTLAGSIPITARAMIEKRLMDLSLDARQTLEAASVIGPEFPITLVAAILDSSYELQERRCAALAGRDGMLVETGLSLEPDETIATRYAFRHALYQDVIYDQLSAGQRCILHRRAGQYLETAHAGCTDALAASLAVHFERGHDLTRASHYYQQVSQKAMARHAPREAVICLEKAILLLKQLPENPERDQRELDLLLALGHPLTATTSWASPALERTYSRAGELCQRLNNRSQRFPILWGLWACRILRAEYAAARGAAAELLPIAAGLEDDGLRLEAHIAVGLTQMWSGEFIAARDSLEQALALYDMERHRQHTLIYGQDPRMLCLAHRAWLNAWLGFPEQARRDIDTALLQARNVEHPYSLVFAMAYQTILALYLDDIPHLQDCVAQTTAYAIDYGFGQWLNFARFFEGWAWTHTGKAEDGIVRMQESVAEHHATQARWGESFFLALLADAHSRTGQPRLALALVDEALEAVRATGEGFYLAEAYRLKGDLLLQCRQPQPEAAAVCLQQALSVARDQGARAWELRAAIRLADLRRDRARPARFNDGLPRLPSP